MPRSSKKTTQNEIIKIIGDQIQGNILKECHSSGGFFSVASDEVRDLSNKEQLSVTIRFIRSDNIIREQ